MSEIDDLREKLNKANEVLKQVEENLQGGIYGLGSVIRDYFVANEMKTCSVCKTVKGFNEFDYSSSDTTKRRSQCKNCRKKERKNETTN